MHSERETLEFLRGNLRHVDILTVFWLTLRSSGRRPTPVATGPSNGKRPRNSARLGRKVSDPQASAAWYIANLGLRHALDFDDGVAAESDDVTIVFVRGVPSPQTLGHIAFHLPDLPTLEAALAHLKANGVFVEDPGDEIGPEAPRSPNLGIWLRDPDGYRLELNVQGGR
jgi:catechol 2,3-dioxygenase-like lactoylglutathione lyase family enzyme